MTNRPIRLIIWGPGQVGGAVARAAFRREDLVVVGARVYRAAKDGWDLGELLATSPIGVRATTSTEALLSLEADCVVFTPSPLASPQELEDDVVRLLASGKNVVTTAPLNDAALRSSRVHSACVDGGVSLHTTGLHPTFMIERLAMTLARAFSRVDHVRTVQAIDFSVCPEGMWGGLASLGFGQEIARVPEDAAVPRSRARAFATSVANVASALVSDGSDDVRIESELRVIPAREDFTVRGALIAKGTTAAVHLVHRGFLGDRDFFTSEECWYLGPEPFRGEGLPFGGFEQPLSYTVQIAGDPTVIDAQLEFEADVAGNPMTNVTAQAVLAAIAPVCAAAPGIVVVDARPRYQLDDRLPSKPAPARSRRTSNAPYRVIVWGPGEIGGAVARAVARRSDMRLVGAKVFSPHKAGKDLGELVGISPLGVRATISKAEVLAMDADCVVVTPQPRAIVTGLDRDVIDLLESGKNVVTSAAYHNVTMPNWLGAARTPSAWLQEMTHTTGVARNRAEAMALGVCGWLSSAAHGRWVSHFAPAVLDRLLGPALDRTFPPRATAARLEEACVTGGVSLHGTGVHPTFMAERVAMTLAGALEDVEHVRFVEAADFSYTPDGMWGGLEALGFGRPLRDLNADFLIAKAGDFYYGDVIGNVAHSLYGAPSSAVRVERRFRGLPAAEDFRVGSVRIRKGTAAALHMVHEGYLDGRRFFTNEECWYLGPDREYRGCDLPFGGFTGPISYTVEITGRPESARMQLAMRGAGESALLMDPAKNATADMRCASGQRLRQRGLTNPITQATAMAIVDAIGPVCDLAPGIVIDDTRVAFRTVGGDR